MRRPQTKQPYAYRRKATRTQGRPVHRIYRPTPRPPMHGYLYVIDESVTLPSFIITFEHNFFRTQWWVLRGELDDIILRGERMLASTTPGRLYNEFFYGLSQVQQTDWSALNDDLGWLAARFSVASDPPAPYQNEGAF